MALVLLLLSLVALLLAAGVELWFGVAARQRQRLAAQVAEQRMAASRTSAPGARSEAAAAALSPSAGTAVASTGIGARWLALLRRANLSATHRTTAVIFGAGLLLMLGSWVRLGSVWFGLLTLAVYAAAIALWLHRRVERQLQQLVRQLPDFLDNMVRVASIGNSLTMAFQSATAQASAPLRPVLDAAMSYSRGGMDLDRALSLAAKPYRLQALDTLAVVLGTSIRIGGRTDQILQRMSDFLRDIEQVQLELRATTSETRMSAWVLGLLPVACALFMALVDPKFFAPMFQQPLGHKLMLGAVLLEAIGAFTLYRLAKSL
ncbi:tight adherence protein B [Pseudoxanthomonas sp. GM95]|uniref:type II secretion system F family protein n=1 Tax=Pseudoxanthomonas sp. GM95 TaxID=1881043 RepID=UPI0008AF7839|nr:type II secretion system F family protein [Pseudoxanthomonas sp. GM95]SEL69047.1 tight adherence protein B [Pseudoxanthomonas sp. GM95]